MKPLAVMTFARMNPPTIGHFHLIDQLSREEGDHWVFLSHTHDTKKNPLDIESRKMILEKRFPSINFGHETVRNPIDAMKLLNSKYKNVIACVGEDRHGEFTNRLHKYNNNLYSFDSICVKCVGSRDAGSGISGVSASQAREYARAGDIGNFLKISVIEAYTPVRRALTEQ